MKLLQFCARQTQKTSDLDSRPKNSVIICVSLKKKRTTKHQFLEKLKQGRKSCRAKSNATADELLLIGQRAFIKSSRRRVYWVQSPNNQLDS
jgi:hypothetical protein